MCLGELERDAAPMAQAAGRPVLPERGCARSPPVERTRRTIAVTSDVRKMSSRNPTAADEQQQSGRGPQHAQPPAPASATDRSQEDRIAGHDGFSVPPTPAPAPGAERRDNRLVRVHDVRAMADRVALPPDHRPARPQRSGAHDLSP